MAESDKALQIAIELTANTAGAEAAQAAIGKLKVSTAGLSEETLAQMRIGGQSDDSWKMHKVTLDEVGEATKNTTKQVGENAEKFAENRRELREAGNELAKFLGISEGGLLAMGETAAAIFVMGKALELLKNTWEETQASINGPIKLDVPEDAPAHISAAATAWNEYATARAKVIAASQTPEAIESGAEKSLANELKLIKEVLGAEKEKALADLELKRDQMTPDQYAATRANIGLIFGQAETDAEARNRRAQIGLKTDEVANLQIDAQRKTEQASALHTAPKNVAEVNQRELDDQADDAQKAVKEIKANIELIRRWDAKHKGQRAPEYEGLAGQLLSRQEEFTFKNRYGYGATAEDALAIEQTRLDQAQGIIQRDVNYKLNEEEKSKRRTDLMNQAGTEAGQAEVLKSQIKQDTAFDQQQQQVDAQVAALHQASARDVVGASLQTVGAVRNFTQATLGGFADIHRVVSANQRDLDALRAQFQTLAAQIANGHANFVY